MIRNRMLTFVLLIASVCASTYVSAAETAPIWVIVHMANGEKAVRWAAGSGANGIEADLQFDKDGKPTVFKHGGSCDCTCVKYGVCKQLESKCATSTPAEILLKAIAAEHEAIGLVIIDSKVDQNLEAAGKNVIRLLETALFSNEAFKGVVIVSVSRGKELAYLQAAATAAAQNEQLAKRIYFAIDGQTDVKKVLKKLTTLSSANIVFGTGITACMFGNFETPIAQAALNESKGVIGFVYIWTIDNRDSAFSYLRAGANGVMTNSPAPMIEFLKKKGYTLAIPGTVFPPATSKIPR
jgi:glycerophosphoryl diester phosphodiesterase